MSDSTIFDNAVYTTIIHTADTTSGVPFMVGSALYVPESSETAGNPVSCMVRGCVSYTKVGAQAWVAGDPIFWTGTAFTNVQTGVLKGVGQANRIAANPSTTGYADLGVGIEADSDVGTFKADLASTTDAAKGTALIGDFVSGGTLKAKLDVVTLTAASAGTGARLGLAEPTGGGTSKITLEAPALAADATLTLPIASRDFANIPSMAANGSAGNLLQTAAADKAISDAGVAIANLATMAANGGAGNLLQTAAASKAVSDAGVAVANLATMAANGTAGNLVGTAAADKALSDASVPIANVVTQAANAAAGGNFPVYDGANKVLVDSGRAAATLFVLGTTTFAHSVVEYKDIIIGIGSNTASSAADGDWVGGEVLSVTPITGNDQVLASVVVNGDGSCTLTTAVNETAAATWRVVVLIA